MHRDLKPANVMVQSGSVMVLDFGVAKAMSVMRQHVASPPPDLAALRRDLPPGVLAAVRACLEKNPSDRPSDAAVVIDMLDGVIPPHSAPRGQRQGSGTPDGQATRTGATRLLASPALLIPLAYSIVAVAVVAYVLHLAAGDRIRDGIVAAALVGALPGFPVALASGVLLRVVGQEPRLLR